MAERLEPIGFWSYTTSDDRSANGTYVNGRRVTDAELSDGDVIVLGRVVLSYLEIA